MRVLAVLANATDRPSPAGVFEVGPVVSSLCSRSSLSPSGTKIAYNQVCMRHGSHTYHSSQVLSSLSLRPSASPQCEISQCNVSRATRRGVSRNARRKFVKVRMPQSSWPLGEKSSPATTQAPEASGVTRTAVREALGLENSNTNTSDPLEERTKGEQPQEQGGGDAGGAAVAVKVVCCGCYSQRRDNMFTHFWLSSLSHSQSGYRDVVTSRPKSGLTALVCPFIVPSPR